MRRMRPIWQYFLFAVPVMVVAFGMQYLSKHRGGRSIASLVASHGNGSELHQLQQKLEKKLEKMEADEDAPSESLKVASTSGVTEAKSGECASMEFPGEGPDAPAVTKAQWRKVMEQFHDAKDLLTAWLADHQARFPAKTYQWMHARVAEARLQRPAVPPVVDEEPDLSWRGIGVLAGQEGSSPLIRVGGGFFKLVSKNPTRARFELARLLAQSWAPCEMHKLGGQAPWKGFLSCMQMSAEADPAKDCGPSSISETGWAVSSALAAVASPPGCRIPAFDQKPVSRCLAEVKEVHP